MQNDEIVKLLGFEVLTIAYDLGVAGDEEGLMKLVREQEEFIRNLLIGVKDEKTQ